MTKRYETAMKKQLNMYYGVDNYTLNEIDGVLHVSINWNGINTEVQSTGLSEKRKVTIASMARHIYFCAVKGHNNKYFVRVDG